MNQSNAYLASVLAVTLGAGCVDTSDELEVGESIEEVSAPHDCPAPIYNNPWYSQSVMNDYAKHCFVLQNIYVSMRETARDRATNRWNFNISISTAQSLVQEFMGYSDWPGSAVISQWDTTEAYFTAITENAPSTSWLGRNPSYRADFIHDAEEFVTFTQCRYYRGVGPNETCIDGYGNSLGVTPNQLEASIGTYWNSIKQGSPSVYDGMHAELVQFLDVRLPQIKAAR